MLKSEDELVAKTVLKKELVTQEELNECIDVCEQQPNSCMLVDVLVDNGYLSRSQRDDIINEIDKVVKILVKGALIQCSNCNHSFNEGLIKSGKRSLRCGMCGTILSKKKSSNFDTAEVQEVFPVQDNDAIEDVAEVGAVIDIPGYEIKRSLGVNYYGRTYKASKDGESYALLVLDKNLLNDKDYMSSISEALKVYTESEIPNAPICKGLEFYKDTAYIVWEYIGGDSLHKILSKGKNISVDESIKIIARLVKILRYANEQGLTHYNVCPSNIIISKKNNKPVLLNTGIHRKVVENSLYFVDQYQEVAFFVAPEHVGPQKKFDFRTDMYALGLVFYNLLAQQPLFYGVSPYEIIKQGNNVDLAELKNLNAEVSDDIIAILSKLLAPLPTNRYQSYKELLWHLQNPERVHKNVALTEIEEEIFEQPTEMISRTKKEAIEAVDREKQKLIEGKDLEGRLRKKRLASRRQKRPTGMRNTFIILAVLAVIAYFVNDYVQKNQRTQIVAKDYKALKAEYDKLSKVPVEWPKMKKQLEDFVKKNKDQSFYVDNVYSHLNELKYNWKQYLYKEVDNLRDEVNVLQKQNKFAKSIEQINRIPATLVKNAEKDVAKDIDQKLQNLKEEMINAAQNVYSETHNARDTLLRKYKNSVSMDYNPSAIDKEYASVAGMLTKTRDTFQEGVTNPTPDIQKIIDSLTADIQQLEEKHLKYKEFLKQKSDSVLETQVSRINNNIIVARKNFQFFQAINICEQTQRKASLVEVSILKKIKKILSHLAKAKSILIAKFKTPPTTIRVFYRGQSYTLQTLTKDSIVLSRNKKVNWNSAPSFLLPKLIKKVSLTPNVSTQDLLSLSFLAKEVGDNFLFYSLLEASVRGVNVEAEFYQEEQDIKLSSKASDGIKKLQQDNSPQAMKRLLQIRNEYVISKILRQKHNKDLEKSFVRIQKNIHSLGDTTFFNFDAQSQTQKWKSTKTKMVNGFLKTKGNILIPKKNVKFISGLMMFKDIQSKVTISFGAYELEIDARSKTKCIVNREDGTGRTLNFPVPINKWFVFSMYIDNGLIHWRVNNKTTSFTHKNKIARNGVKIKVVSAEAVEFENMLIAQD
ncbi:protein kinase domain-containing protein [Candidatus Uabimicrobium amorphum]|uniref:Serine/threonine-protein kinase PknB n=1 Tax=Uabimicrobium amorphum TaxID=2596890 RepID=A0A5S9ILG4_UABAM|nr:protein kinase [Candidatus Uabimicrobium amorphum]BBM83697.1 serine/threonine-protein kinase PknB [Candidatus Uabimicrobium amorphum]